MSDDGQIIWEDPPEAHSQPKNIWVERLTPLMAAPGRWARVLDCKGTVATSLASQLRHGERRIPPGQWEFTSRATAKGGAIYAHYLGPEEPAP